MHLKSLQALRRPKEFMNRVCAIALLDSVHFARQVDTRAWDHLRQVSVPYDLSVDYLNFLTCSMGDIGLRVIDRWTAMYNSIRMKSTNVREVYFLVAYL